MSATKNAAARAAEAVANATFDDGYTFLAVGAIIRDGQPTKPWDVVTFRRGEEDHIEDLRTAGLIVAPGTERDRSLLRRPNVPDFIRRLWATEGGEMERLVNAQRLGVTNGVIPAAVPTDEPR